jgi:hypothetical protein
MIVNPKDGGAGMDMVSYVPGISKIDASIGVVMSVNSSLVCYGLEQYSE